jgi:hypothetical protein
MGLPMADAPPPIINCTVSLVQIGDTVSIELEFDEHAAADTMYDHLVSQVLDARVINLNLVNARIRG